MEPNNLHLNKVSGDDDADGGGEGLEQHFKNHFSRTTPLPGVVSGSPRLHSKLVLSEI